MRYFLSQFYYIYTYIHTYTYIHINICISICIYLTIYKYRNTISIKNLEFDKELLCLFFSQGRAIFDACPSNSVFRGVILKKSPKLTTKRS